MVEEKTPVWDKGKKDYRPASWGDFAVLVPARGEYAAIEKAFDRLGLPYILSTNKSYFARGEMCIRDRRRHSILFARESSAGCSFA